MRPYIPGEPVEAYLAEMTPELMQKLQAPTTESAVPRLTEAERDALAVTAKGVLIYNTDTNKLNFSDDPTNLTPASRWAPVTSG